jgi:hypothetical protein
LLCCARWLAIIHWTRWRCYDVAAHRRRIAISSYYIAIVTKQAFFDRLPMKLMVLGIVCVDPVRKAY